MTDEKEPDPLGQWNEPFADLPVPVEQDPFSVDEVADAVTVRAVKFASPIRDASGRVIPIGGLIFTFGNSATKSDRSPIAFAGTPVPVGESGRGEAMKAGTDRGSRLVHIATALGIEAALSSRAGQYDRLNDLAAQIVAIANEIDRD